MPLHTEREFRLLGGRVAASRATETSAQGRFRVPLTTPHRAGQRTPPRVRGTEGPLCPFEDHLHREPKFGCSPWPVSDATRRHSRYFLHSTVQWTRGGLQVPECASRVGSRAAFARVERRLFRLPRSGLLPVPLLLPIFSSIIPTYRRSL